MEESKAFATLFILYQEEIIVGVLLCYYRLNFYLGDNNDSVGSAVVKIPFSVAGFDLKGRRIELSQKPKDLAKSPVKFPSQILKLR